MRRSPWASRRSIRLVRRGRSPLRAILDVNVLISALISPSGSPARLLLAWQEGRFELIVSPALLAELRRALAYPKLERLVPPADADAFVAWLSRSALLARDATDPPPIHAADPNDDCLLALAAEQRAELVSGDGHLLALVGDYPIAGPADFLATILGAKD
jgi:putative PIN family toxin of toxin-antitoxin system